MAVGAARAIHEALDGAVVAFDPLVVAGTGEAMSAAGLRDTQSPGIFDKAKSCVGALTCDILRLHRLTSLCSLAGCPKSVAYASFRADAPAWPMSSTSPPRGAEGNGYDNGTATTHPTTDDQQAVTYVCYWLKIGRASCRERV